MAERQVFVYKGVEYSLSAELSPEQAKAKILAHLGQEPEQPKPQEQVEKPKRSTTLWEDLKIGGASALEAAGKTAGALGIAGLDVLGKEAAAEDLYAQLQRGSKGLQKWANPEEATQGVGGKILSGVVGMPALPFQAPNTAMGFVEGGESLPRAYAAGGIDLAGNVASAFIPGGKTLQATVGKQFLGNALQDYITRGAQAEIAQKEENKKRFAPTLEDALVSGITGGVFGGITHGKGGQPQLNTDKVDALKKSVKPVPDVSPFEAEARKMAQYNAADEATVARLEATLAKSNKQQPTINIDSGGVVRSPEEMALRQQSEAEVATQQRQQAAQQAIEARQAQMEFDVKRQTALEQQAAMRARQEAAGTGYEEWLANKNVNEATASAEQLRLLNEDPNAQGHLDFNDFGNNDPMSRMPNMRVDENGMPIRADLSMEAQNLENPLQMNMWGDELGPALDQTRSLTEAIDTLQQGTPERAAAIDNVTGMEGSFGRNVKSSPTFKQENLGGGYFEVQIKVAGRNAGLVLGQETPTSIKVSEAGMAAEHQGKGYISEAYSKLASDAINKGKYLESDASVSESAARVYNSLQDKGFTVEKSPSAVLETRPNANQKYWVTPDKSPVFSVSKGQRPFGPRSQQGGQTMLTDLGLGVINTAKKGYTAAKTLLDKATSEDFLSGKSIPEDVPTENILEAARAEKDTRAVNALEAGSTMRSYKGRTTWVRDTWEIALNAMKRAELNTRNYVIGHTGAEYATRKLSGQERFELAGALKEEMLARNQFSPEQMAAAGFTAKQLEAYAKLRRMQRASLEALNYGRSLHGKEPITEQEAYLTSKWNGEIKMRVEDAEGKLVYYLSGNSKRDVNNQYAALKKDFPDYKAGSISTIKQSFNGRDIESAYQIMADAIGRDNPEFQKIQEWYSQYQSTKAQDAMGTKKHFEEKANIRGFIGDRPGYNPMKEANALLQSQMDFAKESFHWAALQDAATKMSPIFQDQYIRDNHPNNLAYLQEQFRIAAGVNEGSFARGINDGVRALGFTPAQVFGAAQQAKGWFMFNKLTFNAGYAVSNLLQIPYIIPHLSDIASKVGGFNPARSLSVATALAVPMAGAHYARQLAGVDLIKNISNESFYKHLFDYAEQNGITSRSIVDEAPLTSSIIGRAGNLTTSSPEALIRAFSFTMFADSLKQTGKMTDMEVFKEAERRTNAALGDFRETERAPIFSRLGNAGNILNTLQTYGVNYYQQMNYFLREALKGNYAPLMLMAGVQTGIAGIAGLPGFQDIEKGWDLVKQIMPNNMWAKVGGFSPKEWALEHIGMTGVDGVLSTLTGVSFASRVSAPDIAGIVQAPGGPISEVAKVTGSIADLAVNPADKASQAEAAMRVLPAGFTGALETGPFRDTTSVQTGDKRTYYKTSDLKKQDAAYARTPEEEALRKYGFRSTREVATRDLEWKNSQYKMESTKRKKSFSDEYFYAVTSGNMEKAARIQEDYATVYGKAIMDNEMKTQIQQKYLTTLERSLTNAGKLPPAELIKLSKIKKLLDQYEVAQ